ncbi:protein JINGUBANG [Nicotiana sylvestris]|uniref:E3 ubiquitin-protein ligase TRAF7 n=1 Tax=Nicotiana sylvestris TaxID=4096 RepID=A0A1U7WR48_NICSY|nr:PREDICTED: E3 ubiquitin-protein ligase TRAF7 [Nicotiana sylvestris]
MKFRSWLATCSSSVTTADDQPIPPPKLPFSDDASSLFSDITNSSPISVISQETNNSLSSLQSNLSLLTLPSVPSLQNLSPGTLNLVISARCLNSLNPRNALVTFLAVHNNLLYAASSNEINVFELTNFTLIDTFNGKDPSSGSIKSVAFLNGKIFTAHQDCKIRVWKQTPVKQHKLIAILPTLEDRLRRFVFPSSYTNVRRHKKKLWIEHHDAVSGLAVNENLMCSISWDRSLKIWSGSDLRCSESIRAHDDAINAVVVGKDGTIFTGSADKRIRVWGKPNGEKKSKSKHGLIATLEKHKSAVNALALSSDCSVLFSGACDRSILVWEREDSANYMVVTGALRGHTKAILCLINVSDLLFSGSADRTVRIWTRGIEGQFCCLTVLDGHRTPVRSLVAAAETSESDGGSVKLFSGSFDGEIKVWQIGVSSSSGSPLKS